MQDVRVYSFTDAKRSCHGQNKKKKKKGKNRPAPPTLLLANKSEEMNEAQFVYTFTNIFSLHAKHIYVFGYFTRNSV